MSYDWDRIAAIFEGAAALPPAERARFLDERCGGDPDLRAEVESLLEHDDVAGDYLTPPHMPARAGDTEMAEDTSVAGFRLLRRLGSGGMGAVWEAEQAQPFRRVALKVLPRLEHDPEVQRRFAVEAELLARMNHPAIAQVFTTGVDAGVPYFAMELVDGALTITEYAQRHASSLVESIALFRRVCAAIAHGHAKGVVHRDIKPSNLLVDAHGSPKVIDFGIARALDAAEGAGARMTRTGELLGTLQYMSPEQAEGRVGDVDAQSDVHALGLVLYEILCGKRAYAIEGKPLTQALRVIAQDPIPRARSVRPDLPAELEWILDKALEKDRARRYASVVELDAELERFLAHEPVLAGPPSRIYQARKFVRRHLVGVTALVAVFAALTIGLLVSLRERARADDARDKLAARAQELEIETTRKDRVLAFQNRLLTAASPDANGYDVRVVDLLDLARNDLATTGEEPAVASVLHESLASAYSSLGRLQDALGEIGSALEAARSTPGTTELRLARLERVSVGIRSALGTDPSVRADAEALLARNLERFGASAQETILAGILLSQHLRATGTFDEAKRFASEALARCETTTSGEDQAQARYELATVLVLRGESAEAESLLRALLASAREDGSTERKTALNARVMLINCLVVRGAAAEAEAVAAECVEIHQRRSGPDHVDTLLAKLVHAQTLLDVGRGNEGLRLCEEILAGSKPISRTDSLAVLDQRQQLGILLDQCNSSARAVQILRDVFEEKSARGLAGSAGMIQSAAMLSGALRRTGQLAESEAMAREAVAMGVHAGPEAREVFSARHALAITLTETGRPGEAADIFAENVDIQRRLRGPAHDDTLRSLQSLARALAGIGRLPEAELALREVLALRIQHFGPDHASTGTARRYLAVVLQMSGRNAEAEGEYCELVAALLRSQSAPERIVSGCDALGFVRVQLGRHFDALDAYFDAHAAARALPPGSPARLDVTLRLAAQCRSAGMPGLVPDLLEPIHDACLAAGGAQGPRAKSCREMLLETYDELGHAQAARALRERMAAEAKGS